MQHSFPTRRTSDLVYIIAGRRLDADVAAERLRKARYLEHDPLVRDQRADAARTGLRKVDGAEQLLRGHGEAAGHVAPPLLPSAARRSSRSTERQCSIQPAEVSMRTVPRAISASASTARARRTDRRRGGTE